MGNKHFHVHGIHEHIEVENNDSDKKRGVSLAQWVAILSAVFSCLAIIVGYESTNKENEAIILKNEAVMGTAKAADAWAFYQTRKMKIHLMDVAVNTSNNIEHIAEFQKQLEENLIEAEHLKINAEEFEHYAKVTNEHADQLLKPHKRFIQSLTLLQLAISLASITALTRKPWLLSVSLTSALAGIILALLGWVL